MNKNKNLCLTAKSVSLCLLKSNCLCNWTRALPISWPMHMLFCRRKSEGWIESKHWYRMLCLFWKKTNPRSFPEASRTILITALFIVLYKWSRCNILIGKFLPLNLSDSEQTQLACLQTLYFLRLNKGKLNTRISKDELGRTAMELCFSLWLEILFNYPSLSSPFSFSLVSTMRLSDAWWTKHWPPVLGLTPMDYSYRLPKNGLRHWCLVISVKKLSESSFRSVFRL